MMYLLHNSLIFPNYTEGYVFVTKIPNDKWIDFNTIADIGNL